MILFIENKNTEVCIHMGKGEIQTVKQCCKGFLNELCIGYGSTYEGRRQAACQFLHIRQKAPILVHQELLLFPSRSADEHDCIWLNYCAIIKTQSLDYQTRFTFYDQSELIVDMEHRSALLQMRRCTRYQFSLELFARKTIAFTSA